MLRRSLARHIVPPPFLYGTRNPLVTGLIRFNEEISSESKKLLAKSALQNPFIDTCLSVECIEVISDETVMRAEDKNHIEAGAGVLLKTVVKIPNPSGSVQVPCAIVTGYSHVGENNDFQTFHSNQAKIICEHYGEDWIEKEGGRGVVITVHGEAPQITQDYMQINQVLHADVARDSQPLPSGMTVEELSKKEKLSIFEGYVGFPAYSGSDNLKSFSLVQHDAILCGVSVFSLGHSLIATDAFITTDCPEGSERDNLNRLISHVSRQLKAKKTQMRYMQTDRLIDQAIMGRQSATMLTALPIGLSDMEQLALIRAPWVTSGLFTS